MYGQRRLQQGEVYGLEFNPADYKAEQRRSFESKYFVWEELRHNLLFEHGKKLQTEKYCSST